MKSVCLFALLAACCVAEAKKAINIDASSLEAAVYEKKLSFALNNAAPSQAIDVSPAQVDAVLEQVSKSIQILSHRKCSPLVITAVVSRISELISSLGGHFGGFVQGLAKAWLSNGDKAVANTYFQLKHAMYGPVELNEEDASRVATAMGVCESFAKSANINLNEVGYLARASSSAYGNGNGCCPRPCEPRCPKPCCQPIPGPDSPCICPTPGAGELIVNSLVPLIGCQNSAIAQILFKCLEKAPGFFCSAFRWVFLSSIIVDVLMVALSGLTIYGLQPAFANRTLFLGGVFGVTVLGPVFFTFLMKLILTGLAYVLFIPGCCIDQLFDKLFTAFGAISTIMSLIDTLPFLQMNKKSIPENVKAQVEVIAKSGLDQVDAILSEDFKIQSDVVSGTGPEVVANLIQTLGQKLAANPTSEQTSFIRTAFEATAGLHPQITQGSEPIQAFIATYAANLNGPQKSGLAAVEDIAATFQAAANRLQIIAAGAEEIEFINSDAQVSAFYGEVLAGVKQHGQEFINAQVEELSANAENESHLQEKLSILKNVAAAF